MVRICVDKCRVDGDSWDTLDRTCLGTVGLNRIG